ncbi:MAG TPA: alpha/beta fold hydrolase [Thermoanaerobaculia bacterium]
MGLIWCLHGFLGRPSDWDLLPFPHRAVDLFRGERIAPAPDDSLIGYSMGGRLALDVLAMTRVRRAVIVSAGLNQPDPERLKRDLTWARRFESEPWAGLMSAWNAQPVFASHSVPRQESDYDRHALARALREWSSAVLPPPPLETIETPLLWIAGERDTRYVEVARQAVARLPDAQLWVCPGAGHRVPWEQPEAFIARLREFLDLH